MPAHSSQNFHVEPNEVGKTLADLLRGRLAGKPWSEVRRLIHNRHVLVNGNLCCDDGRRIKLSDVIKLLEHPAAPPAREEDVSIRYVDDHVVVVEKPAGLTSVRHDEERHWKESRKNRQPTLEDLLPRVLGKLNRRDAAPSRRGKPARLPNRTPSRTPPVRPVHRLDRDTSGLMVFARTVPAERHLGGQFRKHTTYRRYLAVVEGAIESRTFDSRLVRDRGDGRRGGTTEPDQGKRAVTHVTALENLGAYTLIECRLETGRTHQIRIHLAEAGHPICGEKVYRARLFAKQTPPDRSGAPRLALHAAELGFKHPVNGEDLRFKMPLPKDLQAFVDRLRRQRS